MTSGGSPSSLDRASATLVGAAVGNALGWRLDHSSRNTSRARRSAAAQFKRWKRTVGSRKDKYTEPVEAGEFNGTMTVSLGVARSLMSTSWPEDLVAWQIPAIVDAARGLPEYDLLSLRSWAREVPPRESEDPTTVSSHQVNRSASGAIHALPLAIRSALNADSVESLSADVSRVVGLTHGHADAHVAAIALANSLRWLLLLDRTLEYGELLAVVAAQVENWLIAPRELFLEMRGTADLDAAERQWAAATRRIVELSVTGAEQLGASAFEQVDHLGAISSPDPGAVETVAGAMYIFSKDVANPAGALAEATATLEWDITNGVTATGAMLGSIGGVEALGRLAHEVQDHAYLDSLVSGIATNDCSDSMLRDTPPQQFRDAMASLDDPSLPKCLPNGRPLTLLNTTELGGTAKGRRAVQRRVAAGDPPSETMYFVAIGDKADPVSVMLTNPEIVVGLPVADLIATRRFYESVGLHPVEITETKLQMSNGLVFFKNRDRDGEPVRPEPAQIVVYADKSDILNLADRKHQDPDGRIIHLRSLTPKKSNRTQSPAQSATPRKPRMAQRPLFIPEPSASGYPVSKEDVDFEFFAGFAVSQKQKSIRSFHQTAADLGYGPILEVSTKSLTHDGVQLSAFNLTLEIDDRGPLPLEVVFQGGKVFERGGPFTDLYDKRPKDAKKDPRLTESGQLIAFEFSGETWPLEPKTAFYDYLYLLALSHRPNLAERLLSYHAFTDIEFNPKKSVNCQARSAALYVALEHRGVLPSALRGQAAFLDAISGGNDHEPEQLSLTP